MATPIGTHVREDFEPMWYPMIDFLLVRICFRVRFTDTFGDDFGIALLVTGVFAVLALHSGRILQKLSTQRAAHDIVELLENEFMAI